MICSSAAGSRVCQGDCRLEIVFLGTGATLPSKKRNVSSTAVILDRDILLLDCGEGTQRQMIMSGVSYMKIDWIALSHFHGDHVLGIPGLLQSMSLSNRKKRLTFFGPEGTSVLLEYMTKGGLIPGSFPISVVEMGNGSSARMGEYAIRAVNSTHRTKALSFRVDGKQRPGKFNPKKALSLGLKEGPQFSMLQKGHVVEAGGRRIKPSDVMGKPRPGASVGYAVDTRPNRMITGLMKGVDLLIFDSTFSRELERRAKLTGHSTAVEAAEVAKKAGAGRLYLDHISARYEDPALLLREARTVFGSSYLARDFLRVAVRPKG